MAVRFTVMHLSAGAITHHDHIQSPKAVKDGSGRHSQATREDWHDGISEGSTRYVRDANGNTLGVRSMTNGYGARYVQTYRDRVAMENLPRLTRYWTVSR